MTEFIVNMLGQSPIVFRIATAQVAATITSLKTGVTTWQQFNTDANTGVCINTTQPGAVGSTIASFSWKAVA